MKSKVERFEELQKECLTTFTAKNTDYGDSTKIVQDLLGLNSHLPRMLDKLLRVQTLLKNNCVTVVSESLKDTLLDLANYALIMILDLKLDGGADNDNEQYTEPESFF